MKLKRKAIQTVALLMCVAIAGIAVAAEGPLQIRRISPNGQGVTPGQEVVIQFDRAMVKLGNMTVAKDQAFVAVSPDPGCEWRWLDTTELACRLAKEQTFRPATHYTVTVEPTLHALDGTHLAAAATQNFTTELPAVERAAFNSWVSPTTPLFVLRFNMPVTAAAAAAHVRFVGESGDTVSANASPYTRERTGPVWLPVPGAPGAVIVIASPKPSQPLDEEKAAGEARRVWLVGPSGTLRADTRYQLTLTAGLVSPVGTLPGIAADVPGSSRLKTYGDFAFGGVQCELMPQAMRTVVRAGTSTNGRCRPDSIELAFSAPVPLGTLKAIQWSPQPPVQLATQWENYPQWFLRPRQNPRDAASLDTYPLTFNLAPMTDYTVTLPAGVKDHFGRATTKAEVVHFNTGHLRPFLQLPPLPAVLESGEKTVAPLRFTNLQTLSLYAHRLQATDMNADTIAALPGESMNLLARPGIDVTPDHVAHMPIGVRSLLNGGSGVVWGVFSWGAPNHYQHRNGLMEVTPYQVFAKFGHFNSLVWVTTLDGGAPVAGAKVRLLTGPRDKPGPFQTAAGGTVMTDAHGLAVLPGTDVLGKAWLQRWGDDAQSFYVSVVKNDTMAWLPLEGSFKRWVGNASHGSFWATQQPRYGHMRTWAITSQGIYKPGSDIRFAVFVRAEDNATLTPPPALDYTLKVTDPTGNVVLDETHLTPGEFGDFDAELHVGTNAPTGRYSISLSWPTSTGAMESEAGSFMVADFVPASFKVETMLDGSHFGPGDTVHVAAQARLHAGGPYTNAAVRVAAQLVRKPFAPGTPVASGFSFGGLQQTGPSVVNLSQSETRLDNAGNAEATVQVPDAVPFNYGTLRIEAAVQSARGTQVANAQTAVYTARDRYVGLRTENWLQTAGKPFKVEYLVTDPAGAAEAGTRVTLHLQREVVNQVQSQNAAGDFTPRQNTHWETEDECQGVSTTAPATCGLTPRHAGRYRVLASVKDTHGRVQASTLAVYVTGPGSVVWSNDKAVTLVPDKTSYQVGDTAHILVQNPFPGARALVTVERYGVLWKKPITLQGGAPVIDVPITTAMFPGAYLSVAVFSPRVSPPADPDLGKPEVAMGYVALSVMGQGSALKVSVTPDQAVHKPRETVQATVQVRSASGKTPGPVRVVVAVIDQGVLDLLPQGAKTYDPLARFYAPPDAPDISNYSLASQLLTRLQPKSGKGESPGGGGGESAGPNVRSEFKSAIYWNAGLVTDADGRVKVEFKLPDNLTRWRIIAVAMGKGDAMGWGDGSVQVNLPIQVQPALPNQVHVGDRFDAGFSITNRTDETLSIKTRLTAAGAIEGGTASRDGTLSLDSFAHGLKWLQVKADATGAIHFTAEAAAGARGDAMTTSIPVRRAGAVEHAGEYGSLTMGNATVPLSVPANALPGSSSLQINLAPTLLGGLDGAFATLRDDPLNTWEIRLSRGVLAADYLRLKPVLGDTFAWPHAADDIEAMVTRASDYQAPNGGMAFWIPRNKFVSPYLSVYTALAFNWLEAAGHAPPARVVQPLQAYLKDQLLDKAGSKDASVAAILRVGAMAALAPHGLLPSGAVAGMLPELPRLDLFGQALLLDAALETHDATSAKAILQKLFSSAEESGGELSFNEPRRGIYMQLLATPLRSNCAILDALSTYARQLGTGGLLGDTPQKLMRWVSGQRRNSGGWPNSQENVFCTTAITHYADTYETPVAALEGQVVVDGKTAGNAKFASRAAAGEAVRPSLTLAPGGQNQSVVVQHRGQGRLYYQVQLRYALPPDAVGATDAGLSVNRSYAVERDGEWQPVAATTALKRGDIIRVALDVDVPTERHHVVVVDPLPGAFEAVNRQLATAMTMSPSEEPGVSVLMFDGGAWPNMSIVQGGFYHRETAFDAVRFFADDLPAGHYRLVYSAQVVSPGTFIAPAPSAREIYHPDVFGRGSAAHISVQSPSPSGP